MTAHTKFLWVRALLGAVLAEVALFAIAVAAYVLPNGAAALVYVVPPACLVLTALFGYWVARKAGNRFILHGLLVGVIAALIYIGLTWGKSLPMAYVISHFLKVLGGAAGGFLAQMKARRPATPLAET
jgi:putative membrane protein (TIGR04086 family)